MTLVDADLKEEARAVREELAAPATVAATVLTAVAVLAEMSREVVEAVADRAVVAHLAAVEVSAAVEWRAAGWGEVVHVEADESVAETRVAVFAVVAVAA